MKSEQYIQGPAYNDNNDTMVATTKEDIRDKERKERETPRRLAYLSDTSLATSFDISFHINREEEDPGVSNNTDHNFGG